MKVSATALAGVVLLEPVSYCDARGWFREAWHSDRYRQAGVPGPFVQDNLSHSVHGVLRGLHTQQPGSQGKLVSVVAGAVFDVAVDIRANSPAFGNWVGMELSADNGRQLYIPEGFAHGFVVLSDAATFLYKCTRYYDPASELCVMWNDPDIGIEWPIREPFVSPKDAAGVPLRSLLPHQLPVWQSHSS